MKAKARGIKTAIALCYLALISACANRPAPDIASNGMRDFFWLSARFSVSLDRPNDAPQAVSGQLDWWHDSPEQRDRIDIVSPFGQTLAKLRGTGKNVFLELANGRQFQASTLAELAQQGLGQPMPFARIPDWLEGIAPAHASVSRDAFGRLLSLYDGVWEVRYEYADSHATNKPPASIPQTLAAKSSDGMTLKLRIDRWRTGPAVPAWPHE